MLTRTFSHIPGVGGLTERSLWEQGCPDWYTFLADPERYHLNGAAHDVVQKWVCRSVSELEARNHQFFRRELGQREAWRAWPEFREDCAYLDIETDGRMCGDAVTVVGLYGRGEFRVFVQGDGLESFRDAISHFGMIVTFFGTGFDLPMLMKRLPGLEFDQIHLDLCPAFRRIGIKGGLKRIEKYFQIERSGDTDGLDGRDAIRLWRLFQRGDEDALETLVAYNREDVVNLERLAEICYDELRSATLAGGLNRRSAG